MSKPERAFDYDEPRFSHSGGLERKQVFVHDGKKGQIEEHTALREPDSLARLYRRGSLDGDSVADGERRYAAAEKWATDYERAGMGVVVVASYSHGVRGDVEAEPERRRAAKERFRRGYDAMTEGASLVWAVVIENMTLSAWAHRQNVDPRRATALMREGLDELAEFYGVPR